MGYKVFRFAINLSARECQEYYQGHYTSLKVMSDVGKTVMFPARHIRPFMTNSGVRGIFKLYLDEQNKFIKIEKQ